MATAAHRARDRVRRETAGALFESGRDRGPWESLLSQIWPTEVALVKWASPLGFKSVLSELVGRLRVVATELPGGDRRLVGQRAVGILDRRR